MEPELMRDPPHPGIVIRDLWMDGMSLESTAKHLDVSRTDLQLLLDGDCGISPALALKMASAGWSTALFWVRLQAYYDLAQECLRQQRAA
ncbi:MAG: HigA family addiction module antidote protein [Acidobacteriia bacterium]|nr:HigA family addiction module antidote protein [Terriglobia bacterium]